MTAGLIVTDGFGTPPCGVLEHRRVDNFDKGMLRFQLWDQVAQAPLGVEGQTNLVSTARISSGFGFSVLLAQGVGCLQ